MHHTTARGEEHAPTPSAHFNDKECPRLAVQGMEPLLYPHLAGSRVTLRSFRLPRVARLLSFDHPARQAHCIDSPLVFAPLTPAPGLSKSARLATRLLSANSSFRHFIHRPFIECPLVDSSQCVSPGWHDSIPQEHGCGQVACAEKEKGP